VIIFHIYYSQTADYTRHNSSAVKVESRHGCSKMHNMSLQVSHHQYILLYLTVLNGSFKIQFSCLSSDWFMWRYIFFKDHDLGDPARTKKYIWSRQIFSSIRPFKYTNDSKRPNLQPISVQCYWVLTSLKSIRNPTKLAKRKYFTHK